MADIKEAAKYGFNLYPFAGMIIIGMFLSQFGVRLIQIAVPSLAQSSTAVSVVLVLVLQLIGGILALSGAFAALYKILEDAE
jgi:hypothetical protein